MTINKRLSSSASTAFCMLSSKACRDPLHITAHLAPRPSLIQRELRTFRIFRQGEGSFPNSPLAFPAPPHLFRRVALSWAALAKAPSPRRQRVWRRQQDRARERDGDVRGGRWRDGPRGDRNPRRRA